MQRITMILLLFVLSASLIFAQENLRPGSKKLQARRAAELDAYRQLAEAIYEVRIDSQTLVEDFVTVGDQIKAELRNQVIQGARFIATRYLPDGTCEVDAVVYLADLVKFLRANRKHAGDKWQNQNFADIDKLNDFPENMIKVTGTGTVDPGVTKVAIDNLQNEIVALKEQLTRSRSKLARQQQQLSKLSAIKELAGQQKERIAKLESGEAELRKQLAAFTEDSGKLASVQSHNRRLLQENNRLLTNIQELQKSVNQLHVEKQQLKTTIEQWKQQSSTAEALEKVTPQQKRKARRAAIIDGYRLLLEWLKGIKIDANTTVRNFVAESDEINAATRGFIRGAQIGDVRYLADGTCEVDMEIHIDQFVRFLRQTARRHSKWAPSRFNNIYKHENRRVIKVTGTGTFK